MKAISIYPESVEIGTKSHPVIRLYADSAIGRDVMPLFVPDIQVKWDTRVCLAVRIVRLGKNIAPKFALRYIDAVGLVNVLTPYGDGAKALIDSGCIQTLDSVVTTGHWIECNINDLAKVDIQVNDTFVSYDTSALPIAESVSAISRLATIKTGDIIIIEPTAVTLPLIIDTVIKGSINDQLCLNLKIK